MESDNPNKKNSAEQLSTSSNPLSTPKQQSIPQIEVQNSGVSRSDPELRTAQLKNDTLSVTPASLDRKSSDVGSFVSVTKLEDDEIIIEGLPSLMAPLPAITATSLPNAQQREPSKTEAVILEVEPPTPSDISSSASRSNVAPAQQDGPVKEPLAAVSQLQQQVQPPKAASYDPLVKQKSDPVIAKKPSNHVIQPNQPQQQNANKSNISVNNGSNLGADLNSSGNNRSPVDRISMSGYYSAEALTPKSGDKPVLEHIVTVNNYEDWKLKNKDTPVLDHIEEVLRPSGKGKRQSQQPQPQPLQPPQQQQTPPRKESKSNSSSQTPPNAPQKRVSLSLGQNAGSKILSSAVLDETPNSSLSSTSSNSGAAKKRLPATPEEAKKRQSMSESNGIVRSIATQTDVSETAHLKPSDGAMLIPELPSTKVYAPRDANGNRYSSFDDLANNAAFNGIRQRSNGKQVKGRIRRKERLDDKPEKAGEGAKSERGVIRRKSEKVIEPGQIKISVEKEKDKVKDKEKVASENVKKRRNTGEYAPLEHLRKQWAGGHHMVMGGVSKVTKWINHRTTSYRVQLWISTIKTIQGRFGTAVASYFIVNRWVFLMNITLAMLWFFLVVLQGILDMEKPVVFPNGQVNVNNITHWDAFKFEKLDARGNVINTPFDFFTGDGLYDTFFFYPFYQNNMINNTYRMDLAYLLVAFFWFAVSFISIIRAMREQYVEQPDMASSFNVDKVVPFASTAFASWDFAICSQETRENQKIAITTLFRSSITADQIKFSRETEYAENKTEIVFRRVSGNLLSLGIIVLALLAIFPTGTIALKINNYIPNTVVIAIINTVFPPLFHLLVKWEKWFDPARENAFALARSYVLKIAGLFILMLDLFNIEATNAEFMWEFKKVGQKFYQLLWLDTAISIGTTIGDSILHRAVFGRYEFNISSNTLEIIYRQAIIWIGAIYCPVLPLIASVTSFFIFIIKAQTVIWFASPPKKIYSSSAQVFYSMLFFCVTLLVSSGPIWFAMTGLKPSKGPHQYFIDGTVNDTAYVAIPKWVDSLPVIWRVFLNRLGSITVVGPFIAILCVWVYYMHAKATKRAYKVKELQAEVTSEREDKKYLLRFYKVQT